MAAPYDQDLRDRVLAAYDRGMTTRQIARTFAVSPAWARRVKQVRREEQRTTPKPMGGVRVVKIDLEELRRQVAAQPDATLAELHHRLGGKDRCCVSAVAMALRRLGLSYKKKRSTPASRTGRTWPDGEPSGRSSKSRRFRGGESLSTKPAPRPT